MYTLGSKYSIKSLMAVSFQKLEKAMDDCWDQPGFSDVIRLCFNRAVKDADAKALHEVVLQIIQANKKALMEDTKVVDTIASIAPLASAL